MNWLMGRISTALFDSKRARPDFGLRLKIFYPLVSLILGPRTTVLLPDGGPNHSPQFFPLCFRSRDRVLFDRRDRFFLHSRHVGVLEDTSE
jgi:hypothetical protein